MMGGFHVLCIRTLVLGASAAAALRLSPSAGATILAGGVHRQTDFVPPALVAALRQDLAGLAAAGRFNVGASYSSDGAKDDLRSALTCRPIAGVDQGDDPGDTDAFWELHGALDSARVQLGSLLGRELRSGMEAVYVLYPEGGYYRRHVDSVEGVDSGGSGQRAVSFICYLNEPGWSASDGGMLRVFDSAGGERVREDLPPESGSLVLFDSKRVSHEVLPTRRQRACLVGWFRA